MSSYSFPLSMSRRSRCEQDAARLASAPLPAPNAMGLSQRDLVTVLGYAPDERNTDPAIGIPVPPLPVWARNQAPWVHLPQALPSNERFWYTGTVAPSSDDCLCRRNQ